MLWCKELKDCYIDVVKGYKKAKDNNSTHLFSDNVLKILSEAGYIHDHGIDDNINIEEASRPYYDYLKYGNKPQQQEEVKEEPIMIDNNYNYETPYSFEYEPYMIEFNHEIDTSNSIQMIEEMYNEDNIEEDVDSNDVINIMDVLSNKVKEVKKCIIHYISNYRPIMNQYTHNIDTILIE